MTRHTKPVILLVDGNPERRHRFAETFHTDYHVETVTTHSRAIYLLHSTRKYDAVIAHQPEGEPLGLNVLETSHHVQPNALRVLLASTETEEIVHSAFFHARVNHFMLEPIGLVELKSALDIGLRERDLAQQNVELKNALKCHQERLHEALRSVREQEARIEQEVQLRTRQLREANRELEILACRDSLTGLFNRRYFDISIESEIARARRDKQSLGLLFIDVDHFKNYNDVLGHPAGDAALKTVGAIIDNRFLKEGVCLPSRKSDIAARYGGEEFVMLLPNTNKSGAAVKANRVRDAIESHQFYKEEVQPMGRVTVSVGVASYPEDASDIPALINNADASLLNAKINGRNQIYLSQ